MNDPKQEIYDILYQFKGGESVLDVGCGIKSESYPIDHIPHILLYKQDDINFVGIDLINGIDWYCHNPGDYDIIIANDLFPNVDQRLELFLDKYLPHCREMRLSLTYFDEPKWYRAKRVDGDEVLTMQAWDIVQLARVLPVSIKKVKYLGEFPNGRRVLLVWLKGGLA